MARDPDIIEREIEQARDALAATLDELSVRADPKRIIESGKQSLQATLQTALADPRVRYSLIGVGALVALLMIRGLFR
ncbi:MAG: DUF3618 domain-containing protein [Actinomycetota bacterium]|nr:DUF3618 domain-containing protein [Actinomycetota bacterium]